MLHKRLKLLNAYRKSIATAIETHDVEMIQEVARKQVKAGAHYIDVNAGIFPGLGARSSTDRGKGRTGGINERNGIEGRGNRSE